MPAPTTVAGEILVCFRRRPNDKGETTMRQVLALTLFMMISIYLKCSHLKELKQA